MSGRRRAVSARGQSVPHAPATPPPFALYVRPVPGHLVTRFGHRSYIGATVAVVDGETVVTWDESAVVPITHEEFRRYRREYRDALRDGDLKAATAADFETTEDP